MRALLATSAAVTATALIGGAASTDTAWFRGLRKPPIQPPAAVFPVVWTALYAVIAGASATVIDRLDDAPLHEASAREFEAALGVNLALNAGWTWTFFRAHRPALATVHSAVLAASSADLVRRARAVSPGAGAALAPYAAWTAFATVLSGTIAWVNRKP